MSDPVSGCRVPATGLSWCILPASFMEGSLAGFESFAPGPGLVVRWLLPE